MTPAVRPARSRLRRVRGLRYHFNCWGRASEDVVLLLHGYMDCGRSFQFLADALDARRYLIAPDWRGFGRTDWADGYWFPDYLADLDAMLELLSPDRPVDLIGHSMGGNIACLYAGVRPDRVRRVVNLEGFGLPASSPDEAPGRYRRWLDQLRGPVRESHYASFDELAAQLAERNPRLTADRAKYLARALARRDGDASVRLRADPRHRLVNPVLYRLEEARACWRAIRAPVLFVAGGQSEYLRWLGGQDAGSHAEHVRDHRVAVIEDAGHMLHHDVPQHLAQLIEGFLT